MNIFANMSMGILVSTAVLVLGVLAYSVYKRREFRSNRRVLTSYEEKCIELESDFIYFDEKVARKNK